MRRDSGCRERWRNRVESHRHPVCLVDLELYWVTLRESSPHGASLFYLLESMYRREAKVDEECGFPPSLPPYRQQFRIRTRYHRSGCYSELKGFH